MKYKITRTDDTVLEVRITYESLGQPFNFLLQSDVHFDNPKCNRKLYFSHLEEARKRDAGVFCFGDFFCLMQGRNDRRMTKGSIRPEHNTDNYQDTVILDTHAQIKEYASRFIAFSDGNHETAVVKNIETNPLSRLVSRLRLENKADAHHLPYNGYIKFVFTLPDGSRVRTWKLAFHHGKWGGVVSKGVQAVARYSSIFPDADAIISGHTHDSWLVQHPQYRINNSGKMVQKTQWHVKTATYKDEFKTGSGFAVEKIVQPKPLGGWFLKLQPYQERVKASFEVAN